MDYGDSNMAHLSVCFGNVHNTLSYLYIHDTGGDQATIWSLCTGGEYFQGTYFMFEWVLAFYSSILWDIHVANLHFSYPWSFPQLLLKFDKGTYAKRLGRVYKNEFNVTAPENILELAKAMPFVLIEKWVISLCDVSYAVHVYIPLLLSDVHCM